MPVGAAATSTMSSTATATATSSSSATDTMTASSTCGSVAVLARPSVVCVPPACRQPWHCARFHPHLRLHCRHAHINGVLQQQHHRHEYVPLLPV
jgi:hypothetical protein